MSKEQIGLGVAGVLCAALFIAALLVAPASPPPSGAPLAVSTPTQPAGAGAEPVAGAEPAMGAKPATSGEPVPGAEPVAGGGAAAPAEPTAGGAAASGGAEGPAAGGTPEANSFAEQSRRDVVLFFQQEDAENLGPEHRKIFLTSSPVDQAKQIVGELISGPRDPGMLPTVPPQTTLLGLYLDRAGTAYVDLSQEVVTQHPGGSDEEMATIFSIVDSLAYNLPEIKRVRFLVGGEERETLKEHLDLKRDYKPDMSIVDLERQR